MLSAAVTHLDEGPSLEILLTYSLWVYGDNSVHRRPTVDENNTNELDVSMTNQSLEDGSRDAQFVKFPNPLYTCRFNNNLPHNLLLKKAIQWPK
jgi:hypothetical protein